MLIGNPHKTKAIIRISCVLMVCWAILWGCSGKPWNNPYSMKKIKENIFFSSFSERPKTLDPARSYSSNEATFTAQIYEPPLQYDYLKRPYTLVPLTAVDLPKLEFLNKQGEVLPSDAPFQDIAFSRYIISIKPGIFYQPHPAFAKQNGLYRYHNLSSDEAENYIKLADFKELGTRELTADDYVYEIKRLASPKVQSPIFGLMSQHIVGFKEFHQQLAGVKQKGFLDLRNYTLRGVKALDRYTYEIILKGQYPQFKYWLAMPFFAPIPWEADQFYSQPILADHNITFDWYPVGTGPYMLRENNPNLRMIMGKNPNFHGEKYPKEGKRAGQSLPFIDEFYFTLEKESIPRWTKFLQGYYDQSGVSSDNFDQAIRIDQKGEPYLTQEMKQKGVYLQTTIEPGIFYMGFNMLDDVVGGNSARARKLRQAISIAMDYEEYISIFLNGRGLVAQGPIPPGIFGYIEDPMGIKSDSRSLAYAKKLMAEAGYKGGQDEKTGRPLILYFDTASSGGPDDRAQFEWLRKQFAKLGIQLQIRATQYNRFQEKMRTGNAQIFMWGWMADYPDPENFLFLLYGPNSKVKYGGENAANYSNPEFDRLFEQMKNLPNNRERLELISKMVSILRRDTPWVWGFYPKNFLLSQEWVEKSEPNAMANNTLKYRYIYPKFRYEKIIAWNHPIFWPIIVFLLALIASFIPVFWHYYKKEHTSQINRL